MRDLLEQSVELLREVRRTTRSLPVRLRALNALTYVLDVLFIQQIPVLLLDRHQGGEAAAQVRELGSRAAFLLNDANETLRTSILPRLEERGLQLRRVEECTPEQRAWIAAHFVEKVRPLLTPLAVDAGRPFPQISAHSLNLLAVVETPMHFDVDLPSFARLKLPRKVPRLIEVDSEHAPGKVRTFVLSEDMVRVSIGALFPGMRMAGVHQFRILRGDMLDASQPVGRHAALARQKAWPVVRIDIESDMPPWVLRWLQENMEAPEAVVLRRVPPLGLGTLAAEWADRLAP